MSRRRPLVLHGRLFAIGLSLLLLLGATGGSGTSSTQDQHCLDHRSSEFQKYESSNSAGLDDLGVSSLDVYVPPAGTVFCVKAGTANTGELTADGRSLRAYLDAAPIAANAGYYLVYRSQPPAYELAWDPQPAYAEKDERVYAAGGLDPRVLVTDAETNDPVEGAYILVDLVPDRDPSDLDGTIEVRSNEQGYAVFDDLQIGELGEGFTLVASSPFAAVDATSSAFNVFDQAVEVSCEEDNTDDTDTCSPPEFVPPGPNPVYSFGLNGTISDDEDGVFFVGFGVVSSGTCSAPAKTKVSRIPGEFTIAGVGFDSKTLVLTIDEAWDKSTYSSVGVSQYQICAQPAPPATANSLFNDRYSGLRVVGTITNDVNGDPVSGLPAGYLPDCSKSVGAPCVVSRIKVDGSPIITIRWGSRFTFK
jgi:hypothetical protein